MTEVRETKQGRCTKGIRSEVVPRSGQEYAIQGPHEESRGDQGARNENEGVY